MSKIKKEFWLFSVILLLLLSCNRESEKALVVATVGAHKIFADDLKDRAELTIRPARRR